MHNSSKITGNLRKYLEDEYNTRKCPNREMNQQLKKIGKDVKSSSSSASSIPSSSSTSSLTSIVALKRTSDTTDGERVSDKDSERGSKEEDLVDTASPGSIVLALGVPSSPTPLG
jgi:hypothetical protein